MKKKQMWILIVVILIVVLIGGAIVFLLSKKDDKIKTISILGDSISTYAGVSSGIEDANSTMKDNRVFYTEGMFDVYQKDTWWQQAADELGARVLVNNSYSGSCLLEPNLGSMGAYVDRCVNLHDDTGENAGEEPDIIAVYMGTNDCWFFSDTLGTEEDVDYDKLIVKAGESYTYAEPTTSCEAYAIMLHKMIQRYEEAEIYCFTLLPQVEMSDKRQEMLEDFNASVIAIAEHFGVQVVDLYNEMGQQDKNFASYLADELHPSPAGMDAITKCFMEVLKKK